MGRVICILGYVLFIASSLGSDLVSADSGSVVDADNDGVLDFQQVQLVQDGAISDLWSRWYGYEEYELGVSAYCDYPHNTGEDISGQCAKLSWYVTDDSNYGGNEQISSVIELNHPPYSGLGGSTLNLTRDWNLGSVDLSHMQDGYIQFDLKVIESPENQKLWVGLYGDTGLGWLEFDAPELGIWTTITFAIKDLNAPGGEGPYEGDLSAIWWPFMIDQWGGLESPLAYRLGNISFISHHNGLNSNSDPVDRFPADPSASVDSDGDGLPDEWNEGQGESHSTTGLILDAFPLDASETLDTDGDGIGDNADTDNDNDGVEDSVDAFPLDAAESLDTDGDSIGDNADTDDDGDGIPDSLDRFSLIPYDQDQNLLDIDGDGQFDALTDSLLIMRYSFGFTGEDLINGAVAEDATRTSSEEIEVYLDSLMPSE